MTQKMARGFSLSEETLLIFEVQDPNVEWLMKVAAAVQNAAQCYHVTYDEQKMSYYLDLTSRGQVELNLARNLSDPGVELTTSYIFSIDRFFNKTPIIFHIHHAASYQRFFSLSLLKMFDTK